MNEEHTPETTPPLADVERKKHLMQLFAVVAVVALLVAGLWWLYNQSDSDGEMADDQSSLIEARLEASRTSDEAYVPSEAVVDRLESSRTDDAGDEYVPSDSVVDRLNGE